MLQRRNSHAGPVCACLLAATFLLSCGQQPPGSAKAGSGASDKNGEEKPGLGANANQSAGSAAAQGEFAPAEGAGQSEKNKPAETSPAEGVQRATHVADLAPPTLVKRSSLDGPARIAQVMLSDQEKAQIKLPVGSQIPSIKLPQLMGSLASLADLLGEKCTVLLCWSAEDPYSCLALADLTPDAYAPYHALGAEVVAICVGSDAEAAKKAVELSAAKFPVLHDVDGKALAEFGSPRLPRVYLLDPAGKILWFDIEYSRSTRRELRSAMAFLLDVNAKAEKPAPRAPLAPAAPQ